MLRIVSLSILFLLTVTCSVAETVTWTMTNVPHETIAVDCGFTMTGITGITLRVVGIGGSDLVVCGSFPESESYTAPVSLHVGLDDDTVYGGFEVPLLDNFDQSMEMHLSAQALDWEAVADGVFEMTVYDRTYQYEPTLCSIFGLHCVNSTIETLTLTFTCETALPVETTSWDQVKATYR